MSNGALVVAVDHDDLAELKRLYDYQKKCDLKVNFLDADQAIKLEPLLSHQIAGAIEAPHEFFIDNRKLLSALTKALITQGVQIFENKAVTKLIIENTRVTGVAVGSETLKTSRVILATGVHQNIEGLPQKFPLRPVKGQAFEIRNTGQVPLTRVVRSIHRFPVYCVPRPDGKIVIGATSEEMGFDDRVTTGALFDLMTGLWKIIPSMDEMEFLASWTGFRPAMKDHKPVLGPSEVEGLFYALGLFRHGILLSPFAGELLADLVCDNKDSVYFKEFGASRFS